MKKVPEQVNFPAPVVASLQDVSKALVAATRAWNSTLNQVARRANRVLPKDGTEAMIAPLPLEILTFATLPTASLWTGALVYASDTGFIYWSNGTIWVRVNPTITLAGLGGVPTTRLLNTIDSIQGGGDLSADRTFQLVGDVVSPTASQYYGTNAGSTRGWFNLPAAFSLVGSTIVGVQTFTASGTYTRNANASKAIIFARGPGGAGGSGNVASGGGGGGGQGALAVAFLKAIAGSETVTISASTSTFGTWAVAGAGAVGATGAALIGKAGGVGGTATTGDQLWRGAPGGSGGAIPGGSGGIGGGGGGDGGGIGGSNGTGGNAGNFGGGGGGGAGANAGGSASNGIITVWEFL